MNKNNIKYLGLDFGGAHLKLVGLDKDHKIIFAKCKRSPIWNGVKSLDNSIKEIRKFKSVSKLGITMTAELCDNFNTRRQGVQKLIKYLRKVKQKKFFFTNSKNNFSESPSYKNVASMNWLALALYVSKKVSSSLVIDFGSTTTDLILINKNKIKNKFLTDFSRLNNSELIYTGCLRTPIFSIKDQLRINGKSLKIIPESFTNLSDVYRVLNLIPKKVDLYPTCDARNKSLLNSRKRISRAFGFDYTKKNKSLINVICKKIMNIQLNKISSEMDKLLIKNNFNSKIPLVICGSGKKILNEYFKKKFIIKDFSTLVKGEKKLRLAASYHAPAASCALLVSRLR